MGSLCVICMNICELTETKCKHQFCAPCINQWLVKHNTCPMCRCVVSEPTSIVRNRSVKLRRTFWSDDARLQQIATLIGV